MISGKISVVNMVFIWEGWFLFSDITVEIYGKEDGWDMVQFL